MIDSENYNYNRRLHEIAKEGKSGSWELRKATDAPFSILNCYDSRNGRVYYDVTRESFRFFELTNPDTGLAMTDSILERQSYEPAVDRCKGAVLMVGLGIGLLPSLVWDELGRKITAFDILECEPDIINLVGGYIKYPIINIIQGDAWEFPKTCTRRYDFIFLDIWSPASQAIAEGPRLAELYRPLLTNPTSEVRFWLQEIRDKLDQNRRVVNKVLGPCRLCCKGADGITLSSNLYGGLCMECAYEYENYLYGEGETTTAAEFTRTLQSLGYKVLKPGVSDTDTNSLVIESLNGKYLVECEKGLMDSNTLRGVKERIISFSELKNQYNGLKLVVRRNVKPELAMELESFIEKMGLSGWIELLFAGNLE